MASSHGVERKELSILKILNESNVPMGARVVARRLQDYGIDLTERAVRYHLKLMDERGLTQLERRDGRLITELGQEEMESAMVQDKVGVVLSRIEILAYQTTFDWRKGRGLVPINISLFSENGFAKSMATMATAFKAGLCAGDRVGFAQGGEILGGFTVPEGRIALATVCSVLINGVLLNAGIPMDSRFGGILQIRNKKPLRFVELIYYNGSSLDPSEVFIRGKMTSVGRASRQGDGKILANFREIPTVCRPIVEECLDGLKGWGLGGMVLMGTTSDALCEISVDLNKIGMILTGGLNPVAAAEEAGVQAENRAMSAVMEYEHMLRFDELQKSLREHLKKGA